ncbi:arylesterase [Yunchengibacter salinarum]|uniref:arylesterase n=1 Tax=Yunchengibacter salinarum TaxID=3133399 RepID=UPI0035B63AEA
MDETAAAGGATSPESGPARVLALGDSLTAGYGLAPGKGFTDQLQRWLAERMARPVRVINAGVSGDTSSGGYSRLDWALGSVEGKPDLVIVELGANDGLRGVDPRVTRRKLDAILQDLTARDIPVLLAGMRAPPNLGPDYAAAFDPLFKALAEKHDVAFYPFFLEGVAADPDLNQDDGIHPTAKGVAVIVDNIGPHVLDALSGVADQAGGGD